MPNAGDRQEKDTVVVRADAFVKAWRKAGCPTIDEIRSRTVALGEPMARSTIGALRAHALGSDNPAYSGRLGVRKASVIARVLDANLSDLFSHGTGDPIGSLPLAV